MRGDMRGYAVFNKKTNNIVKVCANRWGVFGCYAIAFTNKRDLKRFHPLNKNEEIRQVRVIPESAFE